MDRWSPAIGTVCLSVLTKWISTRLAAVS